MQIAGIYQNAGVAGTLALQSPVDRIEGDHIAEERGQGPRLLEARGERLNGVQIIRHFHAPVKAGLVFADKSAGVREGVYAGFQH